MGMCIMDSIAARHTAYDLLRGDESYKFHWSNGGNSTMNLIFWRQRPVPVISGLARLARYAGKLLLR